ncbi:MAG TPA: hypothetical protein PLJ94_03280 [Methylotenera sp.]|nr:hypothetical protein [Methylotenera sp.]HPH07677.1 hypothetical protein [Methylotenera sp.]HPM48450.1 hypothetical protein [Methylotenera sp.]
MTESKNKAKPKVESISNRTDDTPPHPIQIALERFLSAIDDYREAITTTLPTAAENRLKAIKKVQSKINKYVENADSNGEVHISEAHDVKELFDNLREEERLRTSRLLPLMARSFFIGIFTEYDRFIGELLKGIYTKKPELYKGIKKEISLSELIDVSDINEIKRNILEEEVDSFRRGSYIEQFSELEKKFDIKTLKDFSDWPIFIECAQRRNVMTHNGGCVSQQYINLCEREGYKFTSIPKIGDELALAPDYLNASIITISKVGFMLTHTLWRKIFPEEVSQADEAMNNAIYYLLCKKRPRTASEFGQFALTPMMAKEATDIVKMIRIINTALAFKLNDNKKQAMDLLDSIDWTASLRDFKLAAAVIRDDNKKASDIMRDIGKKGELVSELSYYQWPLFTDFRGSLEFQETFKDIYGNEFKDKLTATEKKNEKVVKGVKLKGKLHTPKKVSKK